jgi:hypothetical protein
MTNEEKVTALFLEIELLLDEAEKDYPPIVIKAILIQIKILIAQIDNLTQGMLLQ